ncbi:hypothetical protein [Urbifossiella limnaea]|uniref:Neutral/alkaline non-lysosomal ceramidase n=1 Tax=Urbifossiella limnaea TaxID=2528023 RepID=A0A517XVB1_9BACT|nr:hypothetical protein [Urbifossiella limnaea]QDU21455.1 Neutral/alkaline non-lysosomal ceramidase [Urbifossiella limnaea]
MIRLLSLLVVVGSALPATAGELTVGFGEADVTPAIGKQPVFLAGFGQNRLAKSVHDPLMARAVVLADGGDKVALVSVDVVGLFLPFVESVRAKLPGFKYVLVSATHNHEGPDTMGLWGPNPLQPGIDRDYLGRVQVACVEAVTAADKARAPAAARIGTAKAPELLRDSRLPVVLHDELVALRFHDPKTQAPRGVVMQWNCHPETLDSRNTAVTADFVGYTVGHLRASQKCPVVYLTGTVGGLMTQLGLSVKDDAGRELKDGTFEKAERYGTLVGQAADRALKAAVPLELTPFDVRRRDVLVPMENPVYRLAYQLDVLKRQIYQWDGDPTPPKMVPTTNLEKPVAVKTEVGYLRLGELELAAIPGEIYPELVLGKVVEKAEPGADFPDAPAEPGVYDQMRGKHRMLVGLANDELGYFVPKRQWDERPPFCYGRRSAQYGELNSVGAEAAPIICGTFRRLARGE